eukprot:TRINITY_DN77425_c0_g1_i1.p1 TRINITY_DN77425_c0_g1~~TRINITY_DN77425_c0_g1_i1.p1  ORF type:complete len:181 (+),score=50.33 TRINITY_DN77425_c0_g1_i1:160-702(+)
MASGNGLKPTVLWAQRKDSVYLIVDVKDAADVSVNLDEARLEFKGRDGDGGLYAFEIEFFAKVDRQASRWSTKRCPEFFLKKEAPDTWPRVQKQGKLPWVKVDWGKWADSDEEDEKGGFDTTEMEEMNFDSVSKEEVDQVSEDRDSILADLDEDIITDTEDEAEALPAPTGAPTAGAPAN